MARRLRKQARRPATREPRRSEGKGGEGGIENVVIPRVLGPSMPHFWTSPLEMLYYALKTVVSAICIRNKAKLLNKQETRGIDKLVLYFWNVSLGSL